jgi:hypothetical protein
LERKIRHTGIKSRSPPAEYEAQEVVTCHHGMARPQVVDRGTTSNMKRSCDYIE